MVGRGGHPTYYSPNLGRGQSEHLYSQTQRGGWGMGHAGERSPRPDATTILPSVPSPQPLPFLSNPLPFC